MSTFKDAVDKLHKKALRYAAIRNGLKSIKGNEEFLVNSDFLLSIIQSFITEYPPSIKTQETAQRKLFTEWQASYVKEHGKARSEVELQQVYIKVIGELRSTLDDILEDATYEY